MSNAAPISLADVADLPDDSWINEGFFAVVDSIEQKTTGPKSRTPGKKFWVCTLGSQTGPETAEWSLFFAPKFGEGDLIEVTGSGIKRKVDAYNGGIKIQAGDKAIITVTGKSAHHEEQKERKDTGAPSVSGAPQHVQGQTVGMALKEAISIIKETFDPTMPMAERDKYFRGPEFSKDVHLLASDIIRVSALLEKGKLAPSARDRANPPAAAQPPANNASRPAAPSGGRADTPRPASKPLPGPGGNVAQDDNGEDVPF